MQQTEMRKLLEKKILQTKRSNTEGKLKEIFCSRSSHSSFSFRERNTFTRKWDNLKQEIENAFDIENLLRKKIDKRLEAWEIHSTIRQRKVKMKSSHRKENVWQEKIERDYSCLLWIRQFLCHSAILSFCIIVQHNFLRQINILSLFSLLFNIAVRVSLCTRRREYVHPNACPCACESMIFFSIVYHMYFTWYFIDMWSLDSKCFHIYCMWIGSHYSVVLLVVCVFIEMLILFSLFV